MKLIVSTTLDEVAKWTKLPQWGQDYKEGEFKEYKPE